jgi:hypothetical protein
VHKPGQKVHQTAPQILLFDLIDTHRSIPRIGDVIEFPTELIIKENWENFSLWKLMLLSSVLTFETHTSWRWSFCDGRTGYKGKFLFWGQSIIWLYQLIKIPGQRHHDKLQQKSLIFEPSIWILIPFDHKGVCAKDQGSLGA